MIVMRKIEIGHSIQRTKIVYVNPPGIFNIFGGLEFRRRKKEISVSRRK